MMGANDPILLDKKRPIGGVDSTAMQRTASSTGSTGPRKGAPSSAPVRSYREKKWFGNSAADYAVAKVLSDASGYISATKCDNGVTNAKRHKTLTQKRRTIAIFARLLSPEIH
jgi:hypothetical protein